MFKTATDKYLQQIYWRYGMRYKEITQKEKQEYSLKELTKELNECLADLALKKRNNPTKQD
jgi:hypothetical protein